MKSVHDMLANLCAAGAVVLYVAAVLGFFMGQTTLVYGFRASSVVIGGIALMSLAIFGKLHAR
jgi:hypothetical protein